MTTSAWRAHSGQPCRDFPDRLDQGLCRKRLDQIGDASRFHRGHADSMVVVRRDVDDRQRYPGRLQAMPDLDAGLMIEVDIEDDAKRVLEIIVILEGFGRR